MSKFVVEKNIPMPDFNAPRVGPSIYPFEQMTEVGDSFALPYEEGVSPKGNPTNTLNRLRGTIAQRNKRDTRKRFDLARVGDEVRVWLVEVKETARVTPVPTTASAPAAAPTEVRAG